MSSATKPQPSSRLVLVSVLSGSLTIIFSLTYIVLSVIALVYRFNCDAAAVDTVPASNFFINTLYRYYILDEECDAASSDKLEGTTSDYSVFVLTCITLSASVLTLVAAIVLISVITTASSTNYYMTLFLYVYIGLCLASLIIDLTLASHFGMDYTYITTNMNEHSPPDIGLRYTLDSLRLGAMFFMSVTLKGYIGHLVNLVLLVLLVIYLVEYVREINKNEHSIHKMGAIKAYEAPKKHETCNHQCDICQHNRNGGVGSTGGSQVNYGYMNGEDTPRSRSPMRDNLKPEYTNVGFDRSNSWQPTPGSSRPFSYLEDVKRPPPPRPASPASERGQWRREAREPWAPQVPAPDYSPHGPRRLKSAMKSYM